MKTTTKRVLCLVLAYVLLLSVFVGCGKKDKTDNTEPEQATYEDSDFEAAPLDSVPVVDKATLYENEDRTSVVTMYLTVSKGNSADNTDHTWTEVNQYSVLDYEEMNMDRNACEGIIQVGDETGPLPGEFGYGEFAPNCYVHIRGRTSSESAQKSYKIKINKNEGLWRGQRTISLNKHVYDSLRFRNKMSYDLMQTIPNMLSTRTQFVHLYVKDLTEGNKNAQFQDYGLFTQCEQINKTYLRNHGLDENGQLYKAQFFEFQRYEQAIKLTSDLSYDKSMFEEYLEIKGNDDHSKLIAMLDDLNNFSIPIETVFERYFDRDNYFTWLAFQMLIGNTDIVSQNFYLYSPQNGNKFYFISWDNDDAFSYEEKLTFKNYPAGFHYTLGVSNYWGCILTQRVMKSEKYRKMFDDKVNELRTKYLTEEILDKYAHEYAEVVHPYLYALPDTGHAVRKEPDYMKVVESVRKEVDYQYDFYLTSLKSPMPFYAVPPTILGKKMTFHWEPSYDFKDEAIKYKFELSKDYTFANPINVQDNLSVPQATVDRLPVGEYFFRVTATNESGYSNTQMEMYQGRDDVRRFGVARFYVQADDTCVIVG